MKFSIGIFKDNTTLICERDIKIINFGYFLLPFHLIKYLIYVLSCAIEVNWTLYLPLIYLVCVERKPVSIFSHGWWFASQFLVLELTLKVSIFLRSRLGVFKIYVLLFCLFQYFLPEEGGVSTVLPLRLLNTDIYWWHPGTLDASVGWYNQWYFWPTLYVAAHPRVGLFPLCCKSAGYLWLLSISW